MSWYYAGRTIVQLGRVRKTREREVKVAERREALERMKTAFLTALSDYPLAISAVETQLFRVWTNQDKYYPQASLQIEGVLKELGYLDALVLWKEAYEEFHQKEKEKK